MINIQIIKNTMGQKNYDRAFDNIVDKFLYSAGIVVENEVIKNIDRYGLIDTGRLRGSITWQTKHEGSRPEGRASQSDIINKPHVSSVVDIGTNVEYAPYHEYGARGGLLPARPYLRPALRRSKRGILNMFVRKIKEGLRG
jgi:hypothetical protein